MIPNKMVLRE